MDKIVRRYLMSIGIIVAILITNLVVYIPTASAAGLDSNVTSTKIKIMASKYRTGSYFSVNGLACGHAQGVGCNNCKLLYIKPTLPVKKECWTCVAFARYVFYELYGLDQYSYKSNCTQKTLTTAKTGDLVVWPGGSHFAIFLYSDGTYYYLYQANYNVTNRVNYGSRAYSASELSDKTIWRANKNIDMARPGSLTTVSASYNSVKISWAAATNTSKYEVWRSTSKDSGYAKIATTTSTSLTDTGLSTGTTYYYKVRGIKAIAVDVGSSTAYSSFCSPMSCRPIPSVPGNFTASRPYPGLTTTLNWSAVSGATGYELWRQVEGGSWALRSTQTTTGYTDKMQNITKYYGWKVRAYRTVGTSKVYSTWSTTLYK